MKILYKTVFSYKSSWKAGNAQLENYFFSVGKSFFSSRAVFGCELGLFLNYIWLIFVHIETYV